MRRASLLISLLVGLSFPAPGQMMSVDKTSAWVGTQFIVTLNAQNWRDDSEQGMGAILAVGDAKANTSGAYLFPVLTPGGLTEIQRSYNAMGDVCYVTLWADGSAREVQLTAAYPGKANEDLWVYVVELELASGSPPPVLIGTTVTFTAGLLPASSPTLPFSGAGPTKPGDVYWQGPVDFTTDLTTDSNWGTLASDAGDKSVWVYSAGGYAHASVDLPVYAIVDLTFETGSDFLETGNSFKLKAIFYPAGPPAGQAVWNLTAPTGTTPGTTSALVSPPNGEDTGTLTPDVLGSYTIVANCGSSSLTKDVIAYRIEWDRIGLKHASMEVVLGGTPTTESTTVNLLAPSIISYGIAGGSVTLTPAVPGNPITWDEEKNQFQGPTLALEIEFQSRGELVRRSWAQSAQISGESCYGAFLNLGNASCKVEVSISATLSASINATPGTDPPGVGPNIIYGNATAKIEAGGLASFPTISYRLNYYTGEHYGDGPNPTTITGTAGSRTKLFEASANVEAGDGSNLLTTWKATCQPTVTVQRLP